LAYVQEIFITKLLPKCTLQSTFGSHCWSSQLPHLSLLTVVHQATGSSTW